MILDGGWYRIEVDAGARMGLGRCTCVQQCARPGENGQNRLECGYQMAPAGKNVAW